MKEEESWGVLTREQFDSFLAVYTKKFGGPVCSRRLSLSFWDHARNEIDTRIRITDGKAEVMQKVGGIGDQMVRVRTETSMVLVSSTEDVFNAYKIFRILVPGDDSCFIYQHDNYIFKQSDFEIKLTHQLGKVDKYHFEVEVDSSKIDMGDLLRKLKLFNLVTLTDSAFWDKWNEEVNVRDIDLSDEEIKELIADYL